MSEAFPGAPLRIAGVRATLCLVSHLPEPVAAPRSLPPDLRRHVVTQDYTRYDAADQATWRFVLLHLLEHLQGRAHPSYLDGLSRTGLSPHAIPRIEDIDAALSRLGWRAVCVSGFVPPRAFQRFQALRVLPIAGDIRTPWHVAYTPAPDIIHEAAGHAPLLVEPVYADYLQRVGRLGEHAFSCRHDLALHDAITRLSDLEEQTSSGDPLLLAARAHLDELSRQPHADSEATRMSRLYWWTAEYGLLGTPSSFRVYGAGLLSSLGEAVYCESPDVKKLPLGVECLDVPFDITRPQPQLFTVADFGALFDIAEQARAQLAVTHGPAASIRAAIASELPARVELSTGHVLHGTLSETGLRADGELAWLRGKTACTLLAPDHAALMSADDLVLPLGTPEASRHVTALCSEANAGRRIELRYADGLRVNGIVTSLPAEQAPTARARSSGDGVESHLVVLTDVGVHLPERSFFYDRYTLPLGARVVRALPDDGQAREASVWQGPRVAPHSRQLSQRDRTLRGLYARADRAWRRLSPARARAVLKRVHERLERQFPDDWLLRWNLLESLQKLGETEHSRRLQRELQRLEDVYERRQPIATGLRSLHRDGELVAENDVLEGAS